MTVILKPSLKKPDVIKTPLVDDHICDEEHVEIHDHYCPDQKPLGRLAHMTVLVSLTMMIVMITLGLLLYCNNGWRQYSTKYQGYCSIPVDDTMEERHIDFRLTPFNAGNFQIVTTLEDADNDSMAKYLNEQLEIEDDVEKIYVDNGNGVGDKFIHDWKFNISGIISAVRCFFLDMDPRLMLPPHAFMSQISRHEPFTVSRVRSTLYATATDRWAILAQEMVHECNEKPLYLLTGMNPFLRKRSAESPKPHFIHFAGRHLHEIEVTNMAELEGLEVKRKAKN